MNIFKLQIDLKAQEQKLAKLIKTDGKLTQKLSDINKKIADLKTIDTIIKQNRAQLKSLKESKRKIDPLVKNILSLHTSCVDVRENTATKQNELKKMHKEADGKKQLIDEILELEGKIQYYLNAKKIKAKFYTIDDLQTESIVLTKDKKSGFEYFQIDEQHADDYKLIITEKDTTGNPFIINKDMHEAAKKIRLKYKSNEDRSRALFEWFRKNIKYDYDRLKENRGKEKHSEDVIESGEGLCGEQAVLYVAMARIMGLKARYANVTEDHEGKDVHHACAGVLLDSDADEFENSKDEVILVDPAYRKYNIQHQQWEIWDDKQVTQAYKQWRNISV